MVHTMSNKVSVIRKRRNVPPISYTAPVYAPISYTAQSLCSEFALLVWVSRLVVFPVPQLLLLLGGDMFYPNLLCMFLHEPPDEPWIPQFAGYAEILAAPHQGV